MEKHIVALPKQDRPRAIDSETILNTLPGAVVVVGADEAIVHVNTAGEQLLRGSSDFLCGRLLSDLLPADNPIFSLIAQARNERHAVSEYDVTLETPRIGRHFVNIQATPIPEDRDSVVVSLHTRSIADKIDRQLTHRGAARSVSAMAAMLAHEVKNPLSGIRGAAQLLEQSVADGDRNLTDLIRDEADRICGLVDRMDVFSDGVPLHRDAVNIHQVLDRVHQLAENGFGSHVRFVTNFDPSLPPVLGNRDQLVQAFLNLVKNAVEAVPERGGEVVLETAYQQGVRFAVSGAESRVHLPLRVSVIDNGSGISDDIKAYLFDPFVTSKPQGSGLGLALVAKIVDDHGGVIECDSEPKRTSFRVMLPLHSQPDAEP